MANTQTYNVNMKFNADMSQLNQQLTNLKVSLANLANIDTKSLGVSKELKAASAAAKELRGHMANALNPQTGQLDLSRLSTSLKASGKDLGEYSRTLLNAGAQGQDTFNKMATAISGAQQPLKTSNKLLNSMMTSFKNVVRYQISSRIYMGFVSSIREAYTYAQDLNKAMTDIRMVTGLTKDEADALAGSFNKVAKELKASTLDIAQGSKIFLQQGDSIDLAMKKNVIATKAAKVAGIELSQMTENLTALWNSYQVAEDQMGSYADKLAALGAYTATSFEEISTAVTKVGATANAVGVNIDQLGATIATVSSVTRESAETTGTAFKTIYARMTDLSLGETLEDNVDLGKVSSALESIGIDILDDNNKLIETGSIVEQLGNKWETLTEAQKTATAQVVAGKRQYTQLMALFENWDMYKNNLQISMEGIGAVDKQYETWQEGWLGAKNEVEANLEELYVKIFDDDAFIDMTNGIADAIGALNNFVDAMGGIGPVLGQLGALGLNTFKVSIANGVQTAVLNMQQFFGISQQADVAMRTNLSTILQQASAYQGLSESQKLHYQNLDRINNLNIAYMQNEKNLTTSQKQQFETQRTSLLELIQLWEKAVQELEEYNQKINEGNRKDAQKTYAQNKGVGIHSKEAETATKKFFNNTSFNANGKTYSNYQSAFAEVVRLEKEIQLCDKAQEKFNNSTDKSDDYVKQIKKELNEAGIEISENVDLMEALNKKMKHRTDQRNNLANSIGQKGSLFGITFDTVIEDAGVIASKSNELDTARRSVEALNGQFNVTATRSEIVSQRITGTASAMLSLSSAISTAISTWKTFTSEEATGTEKFQAVLSLLGTSLFTILSLSSALKPVKSTMITLDGVSLALSTKQVGIYNRLTANMEKEIILEKLKNGELKKQITLETILSAFKNPYVVWAGIAVAALAGVTAGLMLQKSEVEKLAEETERLKEVSEESKKKYEETNSELSNTTSELENVRKKIEELESKNSLTLVEQKELNDLKNTENTLESMLETLKQIAEIELGQKLKDEMAVIEARWAEEDAKKASGKEDWQGVYAKTELSATQKRLLTSKGTSQEEKDLIKAFDIVDKFNTTGGVNKYKSKEYTQALADIARLSKALTGEAVDPTNYSGSTIYKELKGAGKEDLLSNISGYKTFFEETGIQTEFNKNGGMIFKDAAGNVLSNQSEIAAQYSDWAKEMSLVIEGELSKEENSGNQELKDLKESLDYAAERKSTYMKANLEEVKKATQAFDTVKKLASRGEATPEQIENAYTRLADAYGGKEDLGFLNIFVDGIADQAEGLMKALQEDGVNAQQVAAERGLTEKDLHELGIPSFDELETIAKNYYEQGFKRVGISDELKKEVIANWSDNQIEQLFGIANPEILKGITSLEGLEEALKKAGYQTGVFANNVDALDAKMATFKKSAEAISEALTDLATGEGLTLEKLEALEEVFKNDPEASGIIAELYTLVAQGAGVDALTAKVKELSGEIASLSGLNDINVFNEGSYNEVKALKAKIQLQYKSMNVTNAEAMANQALEKQIGANAAAMGKTAEEVEALADKYGVSAKKAKWYAAEAIIASDISYEDKKKALDDLGVKWTENVEKVEDYKRVSESVANGETSFDQMVADIISLGDAWAWAASYADFYNQIANGADSFSWNGKKYYKLKDSEGKWTGKYYQDSGDQYTSNPTLEDMKTGVQTFTAAQIQAQVKQGVKNNYNSQLQLTGMTGTFSLDEEDPSTDPNITADPEEVKEHQKELADIKKKMAEKEAEYLKKVAEKEEEIFKKQQENETEELKEQIEMRKTLLERFNDEIELLDWGIDFVDESDFSAKLNLTSQKLSVTTRNIERLKNEYEALKNTQTKTGEQAQAISERMAEVGEEWRENVKNMKEYSLEMWTLGFDGLKSVLDKQNTLFDKVFGNISENIEKIKGLNDDEEEFNIDFYGTGGLNLFDYIMPKEVADSIEQRKKEDREYYNEQKEVVKETADANLETTKQLYDETKAKRDKEVEDLKKDLQEIHDEWAKEKEELLQEYNEALGKASSSTTTTTTQMKEDVESVGTEANTTSKKIESIGTSAATAATTLETSLNGIDLTEVNKKIDDLTNKIKKIPVWFQMQNSDNNEYDFNGFTPVVSLADSPSVKGKSELSNKTTQGDNMCVNHARSRSAEILGEEAEVSTSKASTNPVKDQEYAGPVGAAKNFGANIMGGKRYSLEETKKNLIPGAIISMTWGDNTWGHVVVVEGYDSKTDTLYYSDNRMGGSTVAKQAKYSDFYKEKTVLRVVPPDLLFATGTPLGNAQAKNLGIAGENYKPEILIDKKTGKKTYIDEPTVINLDDTDVIGEKQTAALPKFATGTKIDPAEIAKYIRQKYPEITDAGIAALLGNIKYESDFNYKASVNERYGSGSNKIVRRAGLFQLDTDRISNIYDIVDNGSWQQQIDAVIAESHHSGTGYDAYSKILTNKNIGASEAAKLWDKKYERSAGKTRNERGQAAEWYLENIVNDLSTLQEIKKNTEKTAENTLTNKDTYKQIMNNIANEIATERDSRVAKKLKEYGGDIENPDFIKAKNDILADVSGKEIAKLSDLLLGYLGATPEDAQEDDIVKMISDAIVHNGGKAITTPKQFKDSVVYGENSLQDVHEARIKNIRAKYGNNFSQWSQAAMEKELVAEDDQYYNDMAYMYDQFIKDYEYKVPVSLRDSNYLETLKTMKDSYLPAEEPTGSNRFEKEIEKLQKEQLQIGFDIRSNSRYYDQKTGKAKTDKFATLEEFMSGKKDNYSIFGSLEDEAATYTMGQAANLARKTIETADNWLKTAVEENNGEITEEIQNKYEEFVGDARDTLSDFSEELNSILSTGLKAASNYFEETLLPQEKIEAMMGDTNFEDAFAEIPRIIETTRNSLKSAMEIAGASQEEIDEALKQFDEEMAPALENKYRKEFFDANYSQAKDYISENITDSSKLTGSHVMETVERMYTTAVEEYNKATAAGDSELAEYWQGVIEEMDSQEYLKTMIENSKRQDFEDWQEILDASKELADTQIEYLNIENHLVEKRFNLEEKLLDKEREINKELKKSMSSAAWLDEETRKALFDTESYDSVMEEITSIREQANKLDSDLEANIAAIKADTSLSLEERQALLKDLQSDYDNQYEVLEKSFGIAEKELAIAKAKVELNNTLNNKNQMMFINGAWVNVADMEAVQKAQDALVDAEYESDRAKRDKSNTEKLNINEDKASELTKNASYAQATLNKELKAFEEALEDLEPRVQTFKELADDLLTGDYLNKYPELIPLAGPMVTGRTKGKTLGDVVGWGSGEKLKANAFKTEIANLIKGNNDVLLGNLGYTFEQLYKLPTNILDQITSGEWADVFKHEESIPTDFLKKATAYFEGHLEEPPVISIGEMIIRPQDIGYSAMMDGLRSIIPISKTNN